jgi:hypothetical protein
MNIHDIYRPILTFFRRRRLRSLFQSLELDRGDRLLDVGGDLFFWELAKAEGYELPQITILNLYSPDRALPEGIEWVVGNGMHLPFDDGAFDVVFSNSTIEHLGDWDSQVVFAGELVRVARRYFIQTPSIRFPVEPHYLTPFVHWLPKRVRHAIARNGTVWGIVTRPSRAYCREVVEELRLLSLEELRILFPRASIVVERFFGLEKSLIAISK